MMRQGTVFCINVLLALEQFAVLAQSVSKVDTIGLTVSDLDRSVGFYSQVLSFQKVSETEVAGSDYEHWEGLFGGRARIVRMKLGDESIELTEYLAPKGRPFPADSRSNDGWFQHISIIVSDMNTAYERLRSKRVEYASSGPQRLPDSIVAAAGIEAFYFRDPDGHYLEILHFPPDKGNRKWHEANGKLFLGIDHSAIVVRETEKSLIFYRDLLGFKVAGESENFGTEQEHLNNVFGARLRITSLRAASGPGVELLEYLTPRDGRRMPTDERANDLIHWQLKMVSSTADTLASLPGQCQFDLISPGIISFPKAELGFHQGLAGRDPDGHVVQIVSEHLADK